MEPEERSKLSGYLRPKDGHVDRLIAVNDGDVLGESKIEPQEGHRHQEDTDIIKMNQLDILFEVVDLPKHGHDDDDACHPGEDGADHEVRAEDGAVPQG